VRRPVGALALRALSDSPPKAGTGRRDQSGDRSPHSKKGRTLNSEIIRLKEPKTATTSRETLPAYAGRLLALDLGTRRVGVAVSDELRITAKPLPAIERRSWKDLLRRVAAVVESYDAQGLVIGLPVGLNGTEGPAARDARAIAEKFRQSLRIAVCLQDERLTTVAATAQLKAAGRSDNQIKHEVDSEAAAVILRDFFASDRT